MDVSDAARRFGQLSVDEKARYRDICRQMVRLAQSYAVPIIFAPPPRVGGEINGATGFVLLLSSGYFVVTASHVLKGYEQRLLSGEKLNWQVGRLPPFDPLPRIESRDDTKDTLLLRLSADEARQVGSRVASASTGWSPRTPDVGQLVLVAGYPKVLREEERDQGSIGLDPLSAMFSVTRTGDGYFICQIERKNLVTFNDEAPLPDEKMDMGGLSGGPALLVGETYPVIGVISEYQMDFGLLRIATLESVIVHQP
jgi:hypothetical protein